MNKICKDYQKMILKKYSSYIESIIIYGSNIYNGSSSDLDVCLITEQCPQDIREKIIKDTIGFHISHDLQIDKEIPFDNKLIYTWNEVRDTIDNPPFYKDGKAVINNIVKSKEFLSSVEMKKRLLLNIFTTDHLTIGKSIKEFEKKAFKVIVDVIIEYYKLQNPSVEELLNCLYVNQYTKEEGEMYLGYKKKYKQKEDYLRKELIEYENDRSK